MAKVLRAVVSQRRAHEAIVELVNRHDRPELREAIDAFGRELVEKGYDSPEDPFTWQDRLAVQILQFITEGSEACVVLECEDRRRERLRAKRGSAGKQGTP